MNNDNDKKQDNLDIVSIKKINKKKSDKKHASVDTKLTKTEEEIKKKKKLILFVAIGAIAVIIIVLIIILLSNPSHTSIFSEETEETAEVTKTYTRDTSKDDYTSTILEESDDAGQDYIDDTLFIGDSNTVRMYRVYDYLSYDNAIGSVGLAASSISTYQVAKFSGYSSYVTIPAAVKIMQPERVIITFGTNDLPGHKNVDDFISYYEKSLQAIVDAYPSVDLIVNSIPPIGYAYAINNCNSDFIESYNEALVTMCEKNNWKFLNSYETLCDPNTGYAYNGYTDGDGIHLSKSALDAFFKYVRTHSYITEDDRPALTKIPSHTEDKDISYSSGALITQSSDNSNSQNEVTTSVIETAAPTVTSAPSVTKAPETETTKETEPPSTEAPETEAPYETKNNEETDKVEKDETDIIS